MQRYFNTEGLCRPDIHYMVRLDDRLDRMKRLYVDRGKYFVINRGRQYGKTTTLMALAEYLKDTYLVLSLDFQEIGTEEFADATTFVHAFTQMVITALKKADREKGKGLSEILEKFADDIKKGSLRDLFVCLSRLCANAEKPVVLIVDEADSASNNQVFIDFLALLRKYYLDRENSPTFRSVILAGVYDIKNLKLKLRSDGDHQYNSPWNIAADFDMDMNFPTSHIAAMLEEYEADHRTGMPVGIIAEEIFQYTSGYPYLVSAICKIMDEKLPDTGCFPNVAAIWTRNGIAEAVKIMLKSNLPLFDSMIKQLDLYKDMRDMMEQILYQGKNFPYSPYVKPVQLGVMFGYLKEKDGYIAVANRIFEMGLLNMFVTEEALKSDAYRRGQRDKSQFVKDSKLDMDLVLEKFVEYFTEIYGDNDENFVENYGRKFFLLYLKPIINGTGNYYLEAQTRDARRTDVIVDYLGERFVVEMKIWHGNEYNERGEEQLVDYLEYFHQKKGYMLSFNFNRKKKTGVSVITYGDKTIVEAVV